MLKRTLGRTGLEVSAIGFGGIPIQRVSDEEASDIVNAAVENGITFFDTARAYTDSEAKFGRVFPKLKDIVVATKSMARDKQGMSADIDRSLSLLGINTIDLYQLHNVKDMESLKKVLAPDGALAALKEAKDQGIISHIGITGHIPKVLVEALATGEFDTVQFPYNPVEREAEKELIPLAQKMDIGMIAMKPVAGGAIKNVELSLKFILDSPISTVIPGVDRLEQVSINSGVGKNFIPLTDQEKQVLHEEVDRLGSKFCRRCEYCQPCPEGIDIPMIFLLDGYWTRYGLQGWAVDRYKPLAKKAADCIKCGACEDRCPYSLPIREMLEEAGVHLG